MSSDKVNVAEKVANSNDAVSTEKGGSSNMGSDGVNAEKGSSSNDDSSLSNELSSMTIDSSDNSKKKKKNTCLFCLKEVQGLQGCSRCGTARYCGRECQLKNWPVHKNTCLDSNDTEDSNEKLEMKALNHYNQGNCIHINIEKSSSLLIS